MELSEKNIQQLESKGFTTVYEWFDEPGKQYPAHSHDHKTSTLISEGSMDVTIGGHTETLKAGDRINIPANVEHAVVVSESGCKYVVGEK